MVTPASRPTTDVSDVLIDSMDRMFAGLLDRLDGLTTDEYLWEPTAGVWSVRTVDDGRVIVDGAGVREIDPAPVTSIAWRMWHIAIDCLDDYSRRFSGDVTDASNEWTLDPAEATTILVDKWGGYRKTVTSRDFWQLLGPDWEHWAQSSVADMTMHASNELVHHAAEIALLRDLYQHRS